MGPVGSEEHEERREVCGKGSGRGKKEKGQCTTRHPAGRRSMKQMHDTDARHSLYIRVLNSFDHRILLMHGPTKQPLS